jgi:tetratricopeptide (TPR) repeat protein
MADLFGRFLLSGLLTQDPPLASFGDAGVDHLAACLQQGQFGDLLGSTFARELLGSCLDAGAFTSALDRDGGWVAFVAGRVRRLLTDATPGQRAGVEFRILLIGIAALHAFLQSNVTGPPLPFLVPEAVFPRAASVGEIRRQCLASLTVEGVAPYELIPDVELFCLAKGIFNNPNLTDEWAGLRWWRVRVNALHQRLVSEPTATLRGEIYRDLEFLKTEILGGENVRYSQDQRIQLLLEMAAVDTFYGLDANARMNLDRAAKESGFEFAITGLPGKRTKFQETDISQLVVFARSATNSGSTDQVLLPTTEVGTQEADGRSTNSPSPAAGAKPKNLELNDDTLLESISFSKTSKSALPAIQDDSSLPPSLADLDPSAQPPLKPLDSIILLSLANAITNLSPAHGLTREETLPYATRVLDDGSTNWQIYSQALIIRSRIEKYKSRTKERGLLQLQTLVDQVIADTTTPDGILSTGVEPANAASTFLPRPSEAESAPVIERLKYIHQLSSPTRWELEMELASRWVDLGGMRTALEIFERLQMWAEVALCWAAADREDKAIEITRNQLFKSPDSEQTNRGGGHETWKERDPPPVNAPRLWCIMGDIEHDPLFYERAWDVSKGRYARAQRSLGRHYFSARDYSMAEEAYMKSLKINGLDHASWFALGCTRLELENWDGAVEAFSRTVQLDDEDAEGWSNLATALLRKGTKMPAQKAWSSKSAEHEGVEEGDDEEPSVQREKFDPEKNKKDALNALKRAAGLKFENWRIWENLLTVAASMRPPAYTDIVTAMKRIIDLQGPSQGDKCIDIDILEHLIRHVITTNDQDSGSPAVYDSSKPGLHRLVVLLFEKDVIPLITTSRRLYQLAAKLSIWRKKPASALSYTEKAWRATIAREGWEHGFLQEAQWDEVVDATVELVDAYESLGSMETTEGLAAGTGELVAKDWRFKARSAVRGIRGRGKERWEETRGWERLAEVGERLGASGRGR